MGKSSNYMGYQPTIAMSVEGICAEKLQQLLRFSFFINTAACFRCPDPDCPIECSDFPLIGIIRISQKSRDFPWKIPPKEAES
jgi:hypothetical protein